jgi:tetratricopeptide (TPR) repeat protein
MNALFALALLAFALTICAPTVTAAQGNNFTVYGDVKVDESKAGGMVPLTYDVLLYNLAGTVVMRQRVPNNGRYRFMGVRSGEYHVAVEVESQEIARVQIAVGGGSSFGSSELRQDFEMEWRPNRAPSSAAKRQTITAEDFYQRTGANATAFKRAQGAVDRKAYDQAAALLKEIVAADDKDFQAWTELGTVYLLMKKEADAERAYESAIKARPSFFLAHLNLGRARAAQKKFAEAVEPLARAVELQPTNAEANFLLGESYLQLKQGSKAVGHLEAAGRLGKAEAHLRLAALYNAVGLKDRAAAEYEQFLAKNPDHPEKKKLQKYIEENKKQ